MKNASTLLAIVVVLGFASEAHAYAPYIRHDRSIEVGKYRLGFTDWSPGSNGGGPFSMVHVGPFGEWQVSFSSHQGVIYFRIRVAAVVALSVLVTVATFRWKRKRAL